MQLVRREMLTMDSHGFYKAVKVIRYWILREEKRGKELI